jgi:hypothetical protein
MDPSEGEASSEFAEVSSARASMCVGDTAVVIKLG